MPVGIQSLGYMNERYVDAVGPHVGLIPSKVRAGDG